MPHLPQERGVPEHAGALSSPLPLEANTENFFSNFTEPHCGHRVPFQSEERTRTSLSRLQAWQ